MDLYEIEIGFARSTSSEIEYPKINISFINKDDCYTHFNTYKKIHDEYLFICIYHKKGTYRYLLERHDNKQERFSNDIWSEYLEKKNIRNGLTCIVGSSILHYNIDESKIIKLLCKIPNLGSAFIKGKTRIIILNNTQKYELIYKFIGY